MYPLRTFSVKNTTAQEGRLLRKTKWRLLTHTAYRTAKNCEGLGREGEGRHFDKKAVNSEKFVVSSRNLSDLSYALPVFVVST